MKKTQCIIFHFFFRFRVFYVQAKEILTVWSSTLHLILAVGYNEADPCWMTSCSKMPLRKQNGLITASKSWNHEEKKRELEYRMCQNWSFSCCFVRTGICLLGWLLAVPRAAASSWWGVSYPAHPGDTSKGSQGQPGASNAPGKLQSLCCCRGGGTRVKEMQTHFKCKYQGNSLH